MKNLILFLIRRKLHVRKYESFRFSNQKSTAVYYFDNCGIQKWWNNHLEESHVSINWLLNPECKIIRGISLE